VKVSSWVVVVVGGDVLLSAVGFSGVDWEGFGKTCSMGVGDATGVVWEI
jgi:hypothetical protein